MNMRRISEVMLLVSIVPTAIVVVLAARGCDVDRPPDGWPDNEGLHKDPHAEVVEDAKQALIDDVLALQQRADVLRQRAVAQLGQDGELAREHADVKMRLDDAQRRIVTLAASGPNGVMRERPQIEDQLSRLDDRLERAEQAL